MTDGAYEALFCAIMGNVNPGDEVIIIEPYFDCYEPMVKLAGGIPKFIALTPEKEALGQKMSSANWKVKIRLVPSIRNSMCMYTKLLCILKFFKYYFPA